MGVVGRHLYGSSKAHLALHTKISRAEMVAFSLGDASSD